ncbi:hypothetical protein [Hoeflea prorocentri]|uniref:Uncharacterized protein n=1 Tax=Hoeflea prorocentri TaxID=1922333 RepID=A0A9X3UL29_9HYPH|nr:hypothetical protein [Hoeflea prorocentri]MCY6382537.1 hypothetical protein [Hoeflea prorocentri]MDA5400337.1 hypothetical protein [Hoeflea prorocentri]
MYFGSLPDAGCITFFYNGGGAANRVSSRMRERIKIFAACPDETAYRARTMALLTNWNA